MSTGSPKKNGIVKRIGTRNVFFTCRANSKVLEEFVRRGEEIRAVVVKIPVWQVDRQNYAQYQARQQGRKTPEEQLASARLAEPGTDGCEQA